MITIEGVVSKVRYLGHKREYVLTDGKSEYVFYYEEPLLQGSCIIIEGETGVSKMVASKVTVLADEKAKEVYDRVRENIAARAGLPDKPVLHYDELTEKMWPVLKEVAFELVCARKLGRSVMLRFHGDADGICGAFAIASIIPCKTLQHNSAAYGVKDALRDIATIGQENRPIVILLDFGSGDESIEALELLTAAGIDWIIIDHHPMTTKKTKMAINPLAYRIDASGYTAGYLACEVAAACGLDSTKALELAKIACAGDKSGMLGSGVEDAKKAMVLDFLASHVSFGNNLDFYKKIMETSDLFSSIAQQADESIEEAAQKAMVKMKKSEVKGDLLVVTVPLEGIVRKGEWPPSSKITTRVFEKIIKAELEAKKNDRAEKPILCIGFTERSLIMRLNNSAVSLGLSANALAESLKKSMADFVEGGGGHIKAGAIRVKNGFARDVLNELVREASIIAERSDLSKEK